MLKIRFMKFLGVGVAIIEWYDTSVCISLGTILSEVFLPPQTKELTFIFSLYFLTINHLGRPIGAFLFGKYSDEFNRLHSTKLAFIIMIASSFILALLPTYEQIGVFATFLFFLLRFVQGIAIGGNYTTSVYSIEQAEDNEKNYISSLICIGIIAGFLIGNATIGLINYYCSKEFIKIYAWRIALLGSFVLSIPILLNFPKHMKKIKKEKSIQKIPIKKFIITCLILLIDIIPFYIFFNFLPNYKISCLSQEESNIWFKNSISMFVIMILTPLTGILADKVGSKTILYTTTFSLLLISFFSPWEHFIWNIILGINMALCYGSLYGWLALKFPSNIRAQTSGLALNVTASGSNIIIPLLAPFFTQKPYLIGHFLFLTSCVILISLFLDENENAN